MFQISNSVLTKCRDIKEDTDTLLPQFMLRYQIFQMNVLQSKSINNKDYINHISSADNSTLKRWGTAQQDTVTHLQLRAMLIFPGDEGLRRATIPTNATKFWSDSIGIHKFWSRVSGLTPYCFGKIEHWLGEMIVVHSSYISNIFLYIIIRLVWKLFAVCNDNIFKSVFT